MRPRGRATRQMATWRRSSVESRRITPPIPVMRTPFSGWHGMRLWRRRLPRRETARQQRRGPARKPKGTPRGAPVPLLLGVRAQQFQRDPEGLRGVHIDVRAGVIVVATLVEHRHPAVTEALDGLVHVCNLERDVLDTFAVGVQVLLPARVAAYRLDEFKRDLAEFDESQLRLTLGRAAPEDHLDLVAGLGSAYLRRIDAEDGSPALTGSFDVSADNCYLGHHLQSGVAVRRALGRGDGGEDGQYEHEFLHGFIFAGEDEPMKKLMFVLAVLPAIAPAQGPAYRDPGLKVVTQVAIVCRDIEATSKRWAAVLGVDPPQIRTTKPGHEVKVIFRGRPSEGQAKLAFIKLGQVTLELIQPVGGDTSWKQYLDTNGEGVQHIAFQVADMDKTIQSFGDNGMAVLHQGRYDDDSGAYVYVDSAKALGVTLELLRPDDKK